MSLITGLTKKYLLVVLVLGLGLLALPTAGVSAAGLTDEPPPPAEGEDYTRLETAYTRLSEWYTHQTNWMDKAEANIARIQTLIDKALARGIDTSALQAALNAFAADYPEARPYNLQAGEILAAHAGFDAGGKVTNPEQAVETLRSLHTALQTAYETMGGANHTGKALMEAVKAFIEANRPSPAPAP